MSLHNFDSYYRVRLDYQTYCAAKQGYQIEDSGYTWYTGLDESEDEVKPRSLGAMSSQEYDNYYVSEEDEF